MSYVKNLSVAIPGPVKAAIAADVDNLLATINGIQVVTLSSDERKKYQSVDDKRLPYVQKAIEELGPSYPGLVGAAISTANAQDALDSFKFINALTLRLKEISDRVTDLGINLEDTSYRYTRRLYANGQENVSELPGADVVVQELAPLFEGQGNFNEGA